MSPLQTLKAHADRIRAKPLSTLGAQNVAPMLKAAGWQVVDCVDLGDCRLFLCGDTMTNRLSSATAGPLEYLKDGRLAGRRLCGFARLSTIPMWGHND